MDVRTPFGDIKVNTDVDVRDTGLAVYPGAKPVPSTETDKDQPAANVNISSGPFGLKVVAVKFRTDDPPSKVLDFYRPKMKQFGGKFLECSESAFISYSRGKNNEKELTCGPHGTSVELKAGIPERQHIVAVKPYESGTEFALVYVATRGKESEL